ncbi:endoplasmic reticulum vesicle protein 25 [Jaminaea rosea]|uniref:Endoplasmic reticulum vesicle protein 25 n=1 Tax=Jaminaea rosea TaxID=1569628 RepID=A0A316UXF2_9BASI|nr:endoplasmic reticulum vesicle protein 25 [Jaminaea rosea]PWN29892.1 endoplasmic reticulum vesicle protein 25 [Jaminaea rosea]
MLLSSPTRIATCFAALLLLTAPSLAIKFDIEARNSPTTKCIWNYALSDTLVIVTVNSGPSPSSSVNAEGQQIDVEIVDASHHNNVYLDKKDIRGETRMAINTHSQSDLGVCITNRLKKGHSTSGLGTPGSSIDIDVDIGADAVDYNAIANQESLSGLETEMRKLEAVAQEILDGMDYLKRREEKMRGTNESTNSRVQSFASLTVFALVGLGAWQMWHLRSFFQRKYLID